MIRKTRQRLAIIDTVQTAGRPLSPTEWHEMARQRCPELGIRTVYRTIRELVQLGRIVAVDYPGQPLRYEAVSASGHHPHFICRGCSKVYPLTLELPELPSGRQQGFLIEGDEVVFFGRCPDCQNHSHAKLAPYSHRKKKRMPRKSV